MTRQIEKLVNGNIEVTIPIRLKYDGHKTVIIQSENIPAEFDSETMSPLQKALVQSFQYRDALESGEVSSVSELARKENQDRPFLFRALSLVNLAPDIIEAILSGTEPPTLTLSRLRRGFPDDWEKQRKLFSCSYKK
ncbi:hypothetical protein SDC9_171281 [bioreactor metagenome]|uniref:Uncharacterized protein n=1 Tax=bioreactor metagenome TaxID=1076179 RepID=A0A645GAF7_9ZZZZ